MGAWTRAWCCAALVLTGCVSGNGADAGLDPEGGRDAGCTVPTSTNPCLVGQCDTSGRARLVPRPDGDVLPGQVAGDCKRKVCLGGVASSADDDTDLPVDGNACTSDLCLAGGSSNPALAVGTPCGDAGHCDGQGTCAQCLSAAQCPGADTTCQVRTCLGGRCATSNTPGGTPCNTTGARCDGAGTCL